MQAETCYVTFLASFVTYKNKQTVSGVQLPLSHLPKQTETNSGTLQLA